MDNKPEMNILLVSEYFYPYGGAELSLWRLCRALTQKGHKICVVTARRDSETGYEVRDGVEIYRPFPTGNIAQRLIFALRLYPYLNRWLRGRELDVVYNLGYVATLPATYAAAKYGVPAVTLLGHLCGKDWFKLTNPFSAVLNYLMEIVTIRFGKHSVLVAQCQDSAGRVAPHTRAETRVICIAFLEPDVIEEAREKTDITKVRQTLGIGEDELLLLLVGALIPTKNVASLVRVLGGLKTKFKLAVVGEGPERARIEGLVKRLNLEEKVLLLGQKPQDETLALMRSGDVLILPSISEQVPNVVLEALALGKPVIATRVGGIPEIKSANLHLIDKLEEISEILDGGIAAVEEDEIVEEYSLDRVVGQYEGLFQAVVGARNKGDIGR